MRRVLVATTLVIVLGFVIGARWAVQADGGHVSGDFGAYYSGAEIVRRGANEHLYDAATQRQIQREIFDNPTGDWFRPFVAPPFVAVLYLPFAFVSYTVAAEIDLPPLFDPIIMRIRLPS